MLLKTMLTAVAASALMAGAVYAQSSSPAAPDASQPGTTGSASDVTAPRADPTLPPSSSANDAAPPPSAAAPAPAPAPAETAPTGQAVSTSATTTNPVTGATMTLTNGPVPDTKANRAKYGQPLSHAGRITRAKGN